MPLASTGPAAGLLVAVAATSPLVATAVQVTRGRIRSARPVVLPLPPRPTARTAPRAGPVAAAPDPGGPGG